jgi:hypothetical protein
MRSERAASDHGQTFGRTSRLILAASSLAVVALAGCGGSASDAHPTTHQVEQVGRVPALTHHLETGTLAHQYLVVRQHNPRPARAHRNDYGLP